MRRKKGCLDTGVITLLYSKEPPDRIVMLFQHIKTGALEAHVMHCVLSEVYSQLCKLKGGIVYAESCIGEFLTNYPVILVEFSKSLAMKSGQLKCQHRKELSFIDCSIIAYALNERITLHTTEKSFSKIVPALQVREYSF